MQNTDKVIVLTNDILDLVRQEFLEQESANVKDILNSIRQKFAEKDICTDRMFNTKQEIQEKARQKFPEGQVVKIEDVLTFSQEILPKWVMHFDNVLKRVKKAFPKDKIYRLYNEGKGGNTESAKKAKEMFAKAFGMFLGEVDYLRTGSIDGYLEVFFREYNIEGFDVDKNLTHLCRQNDSGLGIVGQLNELISSERCPFPKQTIARLMQSFDPEFQSEKITLPLGYEMESNHPRIAAIANPDSIERTQEQEQITINGEAESSDQERVATSEDQTSEKTDDKKQEKPGFFASFFSKKQKIPVGIDENCQGVIYEEDTKDNIQNKKPFEKNQKEKAQKKALSAASIAIGICALCGGIIYALNTDDRNKKAAGWTFAATGAALTSFGTWMGSFFEKRPGEILYIGRQFRLDNNYLARHIAEMHDGRTSGEATHLNRINEYKDALNQFEQIRLMLTGDHPGLDQHFKKPQNKELFIEMAREYIKTWYQMTEEFPDIIEDIMEKKLKRDEKKYINTASDCIRNLPSGFYSGGKVFIDTNPQPWGYGIKPANWREGDPEITKEEHDIQELSGVNLTKFKECHCDHPIPGRI